MKKLLLFLFIAGGLSSCNNKDRYSTTYVGDRIYLLDKETGIILTADPYENRYERLKIITLQEIDLVNKTIRIDTIKNLTPPLWTETEMTETVVEAVDSAVPLKTE